MPSIFNPFLANYNPYFQRAGVEVITDASKKCDHVFFGLENNDALQVMNNYAAKHNVILPHINLVSKEIANNVFENFGFAITKTICPMSKQDIENFDAEKIILKPSNGSNTQSNSGSNVFDQIAYCVISKTTLFELLDIDASLWDIQNQTKYFVVQEAVPTIDNNNKYGTLFLSGAINGDGDVYHSAPIVGERTYKNKVRVSSSTWSNEHLNATIVDLQNKLQQMIVDSGVRNAFYQMQFLGDHITWTPIDFQFRMPYHPIYGLPELGDDEYIVDLMKYAYDLSTVMPRQPFVTCIHISPGNGREIKRWSKGSTKDEAIAAMQSQLN